MDELRPELSFSQLSKKLLITNPKTITYYNKIAPVVPYTMIRYSALCQIHEFVNELDDNSVEGALVEMGCWNGGCGALMAKTTADNNSSRKTWLFDSFEGLPELTSEDEKHLNMLGLKEKDGQELKPAGVLIANEDHVHALLQKLGVSKDVEIVKGWFQDTVPEAKKELKEIALLRLDGDTYESTKYCLENLYDSVSEGGYVVIDDYRGWEGCRKALYEFFVSRGISPYVREYPFGGTAYFKK